MATAEPAVMTFAAALAAEMAVLADGVATRSMRGLVLQAAATCCLLRLVEEAHGARPASIRGEFWRLARLRSE
jgi:hypothetical protein